MEAVLPVCCASLLVAYFLGYTLGEKRGPAVLLIAGTLASLGVLMGAGHPLIPALTGALIGSALATGLLLGAARLNWGTVDGVAPSPKAVEAENSLDGKKNVAPKAEDEPLRLTPAPKDPEHRVSKETKEPPKEAATENGLDEPTGTPPTVGVPAEPSAADLTRPLGTVEKDAATRLEEEIRRELSEPPVEKRPSVVPMGVFGQKDAPIALTQRMGSDLLWDAATENLDEEIAPSHCPRCGHRCRPEERFCGACSAPVLPWRCKVCSHRNVAEADFCVRCQSPLELLASPLDVRPVDD